jgi:hypothetical protein
LHEFIILNAINPRSDFCLSPQSLSPLLSFVEVKKTEEKTEKASLHSEEILRVSIGVLKVETVRKTKTKN